MLSNFSWSGRAGKRSATINGYRGAPLNTTLDSKSDSPAVAGTSSRP